jgi:hypothetical protein
MTIREDTKVAMQKLRAGMREVWAGIKLLAVLWKGRPDPDKMPIADYMRQDEQRIKAAWDNWRPAPWSDLSTHLVLLPQDAETKRKIVEARAKLNAICAKLDTQH